MIKVFFGKPWLWIAITVAAGVGGWYLTQQLTKSELPAGIASENGRIEAVAIDIAARTSGRIMEILVQEGDVVTAGQILAHMDTLPLKAQLREARAHLQRSQIAKQAAQSGVAQREAEHSAAPALLAQRATELDAAQRRLERSEQLAVRDAVSLQTLDDDRARKERRPRVTRRARKSPRPRRVSLRHGHRSSTRKPTARRPKPRSSASRSTSTTAPFGPRAMDGCNTAWHSRAK